MGSPCLLLFLKIGKAYKEEELIGQESQWVKPPTFTGVVLVWEDAEAQQQCCQAGELEAGRSRARSHNLTLSLNEMPPRGEEPVGSSSRFPSGHIHKHDHTQDIICLHGPCHYCPLHSLLISGRMELPGAAGVPLVDLGPKVQSSSFRLCLKHWNWQLACVCQREAPHNMVKIDSFYVSSVPTPSPRLDTYPDPR